LQFYSLSLHDALPILLNHTVFYDKFFDVVFRSYITLWSFCFFKSIVAVFIESELNLTIFTCSKLIYWIISFWSFFSIFKNKSFRSEEHTSELQSRFDI